MESKVESRASRAWCDIMRWWIMWHLCTIPNFHLILFEVHCSNSLTYDSLCYSMTILPMHHFHRPQAVRDMLLAKWRAAQGQAAGGQWLAVRSPLWTFCGHGPQNPRSVPRMIRVLQVCPWISLVMLYALHVWHHNLGISLHSPGWRLDVPVCSNCIETSSLASMWLNQYSSDCDAGAYRECDGHGGVSCSN